MCKLKKRLMVLRALYDSPNMNLSVPEILGLVNFHKQVLTYKEVQEILDKTGRDGFTIFKRCRYWLTEKGKGLIGELVTS